MGVREVHEASTLKTDTWGYTIHPYHSLLECFLTVETSNFPTPFSPNTVFKITDDKTQGNIY